MFASLRKLFGAQERKSLSTPTDEELRIFTGGYLPGALAISAGDALKVPAVQLSIRLIAEGVAALDRRVVKVDGAAEIDTPEHPATAFLVDRWNGWQSAYEGVRDLISAALCNDAGGVAWCNRVGGELREIVPYRSSLTVQFDTDTGEPTYTLSTRQVPAGDVVHVRGAFSRCPLTLARESIAIAAIMSDRAGKLFKNAARPGGWIGFKEDLDEEAFSRMKKSWEEAHGSPEESGKTAILYDGAEYHAHEFKSVDAQFIDLKKEQVVEVGRCFGVPPGLLFEMGRQTYANYEQAARSYLVDTLEGWIRATEAALTRSVLTPDDHAAGYRVAIDRDDLTRADLVSRATAINSLRASEVLSADEARTWIGMAPRDPSKLDDYRNPNINPDRPAKPEEDA